jgi:uncharacterized protein (DUF2062 family)
VWLLRLRGTPEAVARGVAVGMFVAFTPTIGLQLVLAALLATICNANRPAALVPVWITNPATLVPVYAFTYWVGSLVWPGPPVTEVIEALGAIVGELSEFDGWAVKEQVMTFLGLGRDVLIALAIGGALVGGLTGALAYVAVLRLVVDLRRRRSERRRRPTGP